MLVYTSDELDADLEVIGAGRDGALRRVEREGHRLHRPRSATSTPTAARSSSPRGSSAPATAARSEGESTELLEPGEVGRVPDPLYPLANVFRRGHRIRVDVTSSSFPRFTRNLNTGEDVGDRHADGGRPADGAAHGRLSVARRAAGRLMLVVRGATVFPGEGPPLQADVGVEDGKIAAVGGELSRRDRRGGGALALPGLRRRARALGAALVRRPAADRGARAGRDDPGDLPGRARARAGRRGPLGRAARLPARTRGDRPRDLAVADIRGVPRRARRHAARDLARALRPARRRPRRGDRRRAAAADGRGAGADARRGARGLRGGGDEPLLRARLPPRRPRGDRRAGRGRRGGGRVRRAARPARPQRGRRACWRRSTRCSTSRAARARRCTSRT